MDCSLCYHLKYVEKVTPAAALVIDDKNQIYQECMQEAIAYYYSGHMEKNPPTLKQMYDKFYTRWLEKTDNVGRNSILTRRLEDAGRHKREENSRYVQRGYDGIQKFYRQNAQLPQSILAINHPFEVVFDEVIITGEFPVVREVMGSDKRRRIQVVNFPLSTRKPDEDVLQRDLSLTMMALGFRHTFQADPDELLLHYINRDELIPIRRSANDYSRLLSVLEAFLQSVDTVKPFPRPGGHRGYSPYKEYCDNYRFS